MKQNKAKNLIDFAIVFCGGKGTRLGLVGKKKNKSLLKVLNKPIIYYIIKQLLKYKVKKIVFPLGYRGNDIKNYVLKTFKKNYSKFSFINTGINSELSKRINKIKKILPTESTILFINGDTIFDFDLIKFCQNHNRSKKNISLATFENKVDLGLIQIKNKKPIKFSKNIFISNFHSKKNKFLAYSGLVLFKSHYLINFEFNNKKDFELQMFNNAILRKNLNIFKIKGICFSIDNVKNLYFANNNLKLKK